MPKIGDVFSGGGKIGEVWTDSGDGCGAFLTGIFAVLFLIVWALPWTFEHAPGVIMGLILLPLGLLLIRIGIYFILHATEEKTSDQVQQARISGILTAPLGLLTTIVSAAVAWNSFMVTQEIYPESLLAFVIYGLILLGPYLTLCWWALKWWE